MPTQKETDWQQVAFFWAKTAGKYASLLGARAAIQDHLLDLARRGNLSDEDRAKLARAEGEIAKCEAEEQKAIMGK